MLILVPNLNPSALPTWTPLSPAASCRWRSPAPAWSWCPAASCTPAPAARCWCARWPVRPPACWWCSGSRRAWRCSGPPSRLACSPAPLSVGIESNNRSDARATKESLAARLMWGLNCQQHRVLAAGRGPLIHTSWTHSARDQGSFWVTQLNIPQVWGRSGRECQIF